LCAANFSSCPTSVPSRACASSSGAKTIPSGVRSISIPASVTTARPVTSTSSIGPAGADVAPCPFDA
jgi:hypothetical protein